MELHVTEAHINRFWSKVAVTANPEKCWEWLGYKNKEGYGQYTTSCYRVLKKTHRVGAHRMAYMINNQLTNVSLNVCHSCDNRGCVNPSHLWLGTQYDNIDDMVKKGRNKGAKGESNVKSKLTEEQVIEMRVAYKSGEKQSSLVRRFGLKKAQVSSIVNGKSWSWLTERRGGR